MPDFKMFVYNSQELPEVNLTVQGNDFANADTLALLSIELDQLFSEHKAIEDLQLKSDDQVVVGLLERELPIIDGALSRHAFYQSPMSWHRHKTSSLFPKHLVQSDNRYRYHPSRPPMPEGCVYQRYDFDANVDVSFRVVELDKDIARFTRWMNDPRVANFWEQAWSEEKLAEFLTERLADPHIIPLIGEFNGQPFGYIEAYWVSEDRLSAYYEVQDFDRGIHLLVGEQAYRGPTFFNAWMRAISHYLFIDEVRTQRIVLEPRTDNERLFNRIIPMGYEKCFEFNFPHKRSAMLMLDRDRFFAEKW
ncbi:GNAT family N-acetyltransferase [Vibrio toranzoniae]|uniref:GNAT family N-acetyltransferase n=1 Tax=Vibrio toranzoniae TaxID=1194427 RepID=UPI001377636C|nr:GNAT family N-acetyltransferase [Vibrio toranzoniae]NAZ98375.1 GNAT family N-acetyltransferase [Vibrio toranzoniae]